MRQRLVSALVAACCIGMAFVACCSGGCTRYHFEYTSPEGATVRVEIDRFASDAGIDGATITTPNGTTLTLEGYESKAHDVIPQVVGAAIKAGIEGASPIE